MNTQTIQIQYDILLTQISAVILAIGLLTGIFHDSQLSVLWLPLSSATGLFLLFGYLLTAEWFLGSCDQGNDTKANRFKLAAKFCQGGLISMTAVVIVLLAIT